MSNRKMAEANRLVGGSLRIVGSAMRVDHFDPLTPKGASPSFTWRSRSR
jgi:hypothetical protein